jgi:anti-sigma regulatory factor (Ser/Thr protein kinase)
VVGTIALLSADQRLDASQWALLASFADQGAQALERAQLFAHEHDLAVRLQQSLLPDRLPSGNGVKLAGHYLAGGDGVAVGGDWYDALRRPDGIIQLCVGDVSGRGIDAATMMGRQRNTFRVYAHDYLSPAEITRRMLRHVNGDEMVTMACVSLDPYTGELSYSCAGHPPPLLVDQESGEVIRLDRAGAPPIGVAEPADIIEAHLALSGNAVLTMYTDGLIERRGEDIDAGIDFLGQVVADDPNATPDSIVAKVTEAIGGPDDDVALLLIALDGKRTTFELEVPADPAETPRIRHRLRGWLARRRFDVLTAAEIVLAVSEACSNAIEHAYGDREGTIKLSIEEDGKMVRAVIEDQGNWRDGPADDERGHGITVMKHLMHSAEFETGTRGTRVTLVLPVDSERQSVLAGERSGSETEPQAS